MEEVLKVILPKILPEQWKLNQNVFLRVHEGKSDLQKSIPKKIRAYAYHPVEIGVVVLHDQDTADCHVLKEKLLTLCNQPNTNIKSLVRIVCRELEAWYIGDMLAIQKAYPHFQARRYQNKSKFRNPDSCNAKDELKRILPELKQIGSACLIAPHLDIENSRSNSFKQLVSGIKRFLE